MENKIILAFSAHPDDIEIGMAGTVVKLNKLGYKVYMVIAIVPHFTEADILEERMKEAKMAAKILGSPEPIFLNIDPMEFVLNRKLVSTVDELIRKHKPNATFTHWTGDSHQDHTILANTVIAASRDLANIIMYETTIPGGVTDKAFRPQMFVDITDYLDNKVNALKCFQSQMKRNGGDMWVDAVVGRALYRGYQINAKYAEAFEVVKVQKW